MVVALAVPTLVACGGSVNSDDTNIVGTCKSDIVGNWTGTTRNDRLSILQDRSFQYTGVDGCSDRGTIGSCPDSSMSSGTLHITVERSTGGTCLPIGNQTCAYTLSPTTFSYDCTGAGSLEYRK